jgi:hypothetical protein
MVGWTDPRWLGSSFRILPALADLEAIVHPARQADRRRALGRDADRVPAVVVEAIKLVEGGLAALCDEVWIVECSPVTQRARLAGRGARSDDIERRLSTQGDGLAARLAAQLDGRVPAQRLSTEGTLDETRDLVEELLAVALDRPRARRGGLGSP